MSNPVPAAAIGLPSARLAEIHDCLTLALDATERLGGYTQPELFDNPVLLDMGHITSNKSLVNGGDRIMLQSVFDNQWNNMSIEKSHIGGEVVSQRAVEIGGVAVSYNDVLMWTKLTVDADMAARLPGYKVGDTFLPPSILDGLIDVH